MHLLKRGNVVKFLQFEIHARTLLCWIQHHFLLHLTRFLTQPSSSTRRRSLLQHELFMLPSIVQGSLLHRTGNPF